jgi:hypothetical protein
MLNGVEQIIFIGQNDIIADIFEINILPSLTGLSPF